MLRPAAAGPDVLPNVRAGLIETSLSLNRLLWKLRPESETWGASVAGLERIARRYLEAAGITGEFVNRVSLAFAGKAAPPATSPGRFRPGGELGDGRPQKRPFRPTLIVTKL